MVGRERNERKGKREAARTGADGGRRRGREIREAGVQGSREKEEEREKKRRVVVVVAR